MDNDETTAKKTIRVLALDGGGIRGLSSLILLRNIMERIAVQESTPTTPRPCDYFDLIIGTGTGGLSALFVGRMGLTVEKAIAAYLHIGRECFKLSTVPLVELYRRQQCLFDGDTITRVIGEIVRETLGDRDAYLQDPQDIQRGPRRCRTAVLATSTAHASAPPYLFRSYTTSHPASPHFIHEVARATIATVGLFPPISLGFPPIAFIDAGVAGYNNPAEEALHEVARIWSDATVICVVSLGTGLQNVVSVGQMGQEVLDISRTLMECCEPVHHRFLERKYSHGLHYFRFNVPRGLDEAGVKEWDERVSGIVADITDGYTRQRDVSSSLNACVAKMVGEPPCAPINLNAQESEAGPFLPLLNPPPEIFHGREEYMKRAISLLLRDTPTRIAILGPGGMGKTSIALRLLHDLRIQSHFGQYRRFISCEGIKCVSALVDKFCVAFDVHEMSDRLRVLMDFLAHNFQDKRLLIVLDNFETVWDVSGGRRDAEHFLSTISAVPKLTLVVTMRGSKHPSGLHWTDPRHSLVEALSPEAARVAFLENGAQEDGCLDTLLQKLDCVPLAVTLMAKLGQNDSPCNLLRRWDVEQARLLSHKGDESRLDNLEVSIRFSLQSDRMASTPEALSLLSGISLLPSGIFNEDLAAMFPSIKNLNLAAATLVEVSLAYYDTVGTLRVLSPIRSYMLQYHRPLDGSRLLKDLESFICEFVKRGCLLPGEDAYKDAASALSRGMINIETILVQALTEGRAKESGRIILAALNWTIFLGWTRPDTHIINLATQLSRRSYGHPHLAECLLHLGIMQYLSGMNRAALENLREAHKMSRNILQAALGLFHITNRNTIRVSRCLYFIGALYYDLGCYKKARESLSKAYKATESPIIRAHCLLCLARLQRTRGDHDGAHGLITKAQGISEACGNRQGVASCLEELGILLYDLKQYDASKTMLTGALDEYECIGSNMDVASCQLKLGPVHKHLSEIQQARFLVIKAKETYKQCGFTQQIKNCDEFLERISLAEDTSNCPTQINL